MAPSLKFRRRIGVGAKVELTFDPAPGHVNVRDRQSKATSAFRGGPGLCRGPPLAEQSHPPLCRRQLNAEPISWLAQAKAEIPPWGDFNRKSTRGRKRHARFLKITPPGLRDGSHAELLAVSFRSPTSTHLNGPAIKRAVRCSPRKPSRRQSRKPILLLISMTRSFRSSKSTWTCPNYRLRCYPPTAGRSADD